MTECVFSQERKSKCLSRLVCYDNAWAFLFLRLYASPVLRIMVQPLMSINITRRKTGKIPGPMRLERIPNNTGVSIILKLEKAISTPIMDWEAFF